METKFRVRIDRQASRSVIRHQISSEEVMNTVEKISPPTWNWTDRYTFTDNFSANISIIKLNDTVLKKIDKKLNKFELDISVGIIDIELNTHLKDINHNYEKNLLINHYIQLTAKDMVNSYYTDFDIITIKDYFDNSSSTQIIENKLLNILNKKPKQMFEIDTLLESAESKYKLYLDKKLIAERIFPIELNEDEELEEIFFAKLSPGKHTLLLENVGSYSLGISRLAIGDQIYHNIDNKEFNFNIS
jgi:hypothetical protein